MSEQRNKPTPRQQWIDGQSYLPDDDFSRRAQRGRSELADNEMAADFLADLDAAIDEQYGTAKRSEPTISAKVKPLPTRVRPWRNWLGVAAAVLILIAAGWWSLQSTSSPSDLVATHFDHFTNDLVVRTMGDSPSADAALNTALAAYSQKDYAQAITDLEAYRQRSEANPKTDLYLGISYLATGQAQQALSILTASKVSDYQPDARQWYTALAHLQLNETEKSQNLLRPISQNNNSLFQDQAQRLLTQMKTLE
ncbi:MAG: tetratricopeptide repeat protein [Bacteroidota bacterium]